MGSLATFTQFLWCSKLFKVGNFDTKKPYWKSWTVDKKNWAEMCKGVTLCVQTLLKQSGITHFFYKWLQPSLKTHCTFHSRCLALVFTRISGSQSHWGRPAASRGASLQPSWWARIRFDLLRRPLRTLLQPLQSLCWCLPVHLKTLPRPEENKVVPIWSSLDSTL